MGSSLASSLACLAATLHRDRQEPCPAKVKHACALTLQIHLMMTVCPYAMTCAAATPDTGRGTAGWDQQHLHGH